MYEYVVTDSIITAQNVTKNYDKTQESVLVMAGSSDVTFTISQVLAKSTKNTLTFKVLAGEMFEEVMPSFNQIIINTGSEARVIVRKKNKL